MKVQEGNILDVYLWGGRRGERLREGKGSVLVSNHHLSDETARTRTYTHFGTLTPLRYTYTRPTIQPKKRTSRAGLVWRKKHHRPPSSPQYHHHIYEIGNTDGERATNPTKKEKQTRLGWHQTWDTSPISQQQRRAHLHAARHIIVASPDSQLSQQG